jgi:hypothetical protein
MATPPRYAQGQRVRVTQQVVRLDRPGGGTMTTSVEGEIVSFEQQKTGSWFAHSKDHKLWLDRLRIRKADGELVTLNLDQYSHVEVLDAAPAPAPAPNA